MDQDLTSGSSIFVNYTTPVGNSTLTYNLVYPNDPDLQNNSYFDDFDIAYLPITGNYLNKFEVNDGQDDYLELDGLQELTISYQNSRFFASSGFSQNPESFQRCADPLAVFNQESASGINATIHTCVDFSQSAAPTLEFDLAQFRNIYTDTSNFQYSSMLQAKWTGNGEGKQAIFGQTEGQIIHHNIALPANFKGALDFKLYTEIGIWGLDPSLLNHDDFVLLDNLKLSAPISGTEELDNSAVIRVAPNPALDKTTVQASVGIKTIFLQDVNGRILQSRQVNTNRTDLDLQGLVNGFYLLNIQLENGQTEVRKLVKMN